jgi:hypothetical protein
LYSDQDLKFEALQVIDELSKNGLSCDSPFLHACGISCRAVMHRCP